MKDAKGFAFPDADEFMVQELHADGTYQASHLALALTYVRDFSLAIDGGAHVGTWSRLLSARFERVIAVEPSADTYEALVENLRRFVCANVDPRRVALGEKVRDVAIVLDGRGLQMRNTGARHVARIAPGLERVRSEAIDTWDLPSLGFLKLDIEGSEYAALQGATATLARCKPVVLFENKRMWQHYGARADAPQALLTSLGYRQVASISCDVIWTHPEARA